MNDYPVISRIVSVIKIDISHWFDWYIIMCHLNFFLLRMLHFLLLLKILLVVTLIYGLLQGIILILILFHWVHWLLIHLLLHVKVLLLASWLRELVFWTCRILRVLLILRISKVILILHLILIRFLVLLGPVILKKLRIILNFYIFLIESL